jgi:hypothetical protein
LGKKFLRWTLPSKPDSVKAEPGLNLKFGDINLSKIKVDYRNEIDSIFSKLNLGKLSIKPKGIDIVNERLTLDALLLQNTTADIYLGRKPTAQVVAKKVNEASDSVAVAVKKQGWIIAVDEIRLKNNNLIYNDNNQPPLASGSITVTWASAN